MSCCVIFYNSYHAIEIPTISFTNYNYHAGTAERFGTSYIMTTAVNMFMKTAICEHDIPFELNLD